MFFNKRNLSNFEAKVFIISILVLVYDLMNTPILCSTKYSASDSTIVTATSTCSEIHISCRVDFTARPNSWSDFII